jgi:CheY-like chemotaxis protein
MRRPVSAAAAWRSAARRPLSRAARTAASIAQALGISPRTVEIYRANVMAKMQAGSLAELVRIGHAPAGLGGGGVALGGPAPAVEGGAHGGEQDLVVDVRMPGLDGIALLRRLKAQGDGRPVIVMTGHADVPLGLTDREIVVDHVHRHLTRHRPAPLCRPPAA